jgi:hypothetical protein
MVQVCRGERKEGKKKAGKKHTRRLWGEGAHRGDQAVVGSKKSFLIHVIQGAQWCRDMGDKLLPGEMSLSRNSSGTPAGRFECTMTSDELTSTRDIDRGTRGRSRGSSRGSDSLEYKRGRGGGSRWGSWGSDESRDGSGQSKRTSILFQLNLLLDRIFVQGVGGWWLPADFAL